MTSGKARVRDAEGATLPPALAISDGPVAPDSSFAAEGAVALVEEAFAEGAAFTYKTELAIFSVEVEFCWSFESIRSAVPACGPTRRVVCVVAFCVPCVAYWRS